MKGREDINSEILRKLKKTLCCIYKLGTDFKKGNFKQKTCMCSQKTCTQIFTTSIFVITKKWKQLSTDEWVNKMWYTHTREYGSALNKE